MFYREHSGGKEYMRHEKMEYRDLLEIFLKIGAIFNASYNEVLP